jgi:hypothetical protein
MAGPRGTIRQAPPADPAAKTTRDLETEAEGQRYVDLSVNANQPLASSGKRIFKAGEGAQTDLLALKAGMPNLVPHGLDRPAKHVQFTFLGDARGWLGPAQAGFDESRVCALFVSADVTARVRVR